MKAIRISGMAVLVVGSSLALLVAQGQQRADITGNRTVVTTAVARASGVRPHESVTPIANVQIPNVPGKRLVSRVIDYPPGSSSAPHRHAQSAFIYAYVLSGVIRSQVDAEPVRVYRAGETWFESPGAHHRVSENASNTEAARLLAVIVVDAADEQLTIPDRR